MTIVWHERLPSTMDEAHRLAAAGAAHGTAVAARVQTEGRGRRGRAWDSPAGGLWMSVVCRPTGATSPECVSVRAGLLVSAAIERACPMLPPLQLKWPNDLLLHGRKLGGILCEARWDGPRLAWLVIGIGLNLLNDVPAGLAETAATMALAPAPVSPEILAAPVAEALAAAGRQSGPLNPEELAAWHARDWLRGHRVSGRANGVAEGLTPDGALLVRESSGGVRPVSAGEVVLAR